MTHQHN